MLAVRPRKQGESQKKYRALHPNAERLRHQRRYRGDPNVAIRKKTQAMIKSGKLVLERCQFCGATEGLEAHHIRDTKDSVYEVQKIIAVCNKHHRLVDMPKRVELGVPLILCNADAITETASESAIIEWVKDNEPWKLM